MLANVRRMRNNVKLKTYRTVCDPPDLRYSNTVHILATQTTLIKSMSVCRAICTGFTRYLQMVIMVLNWCFWPYILNIIHIPGRCELLYINNTNFQMNTVLYEKQQCSIYSTIPNVCHKHTFILYIALKMNNNQITHDDAYLCVFQAFAKRQSSVL